MLFILVCQTYPVTTDGDVEDDVQRGRGEGVPDALVADATTSDLHKLSTVPVPGDGLAGPCGSTVENDTPGVPAIVTETSAAADSAVLVADTAGRDVAVNSAVTGVYTVDGLEDVNLTALGPGGTVADRVTKKPEGGPDALLLRRRVVTEPDLGLNDGLVAIGGREHVFGLKTGRGPLSVAVLGHDLNRRSTGKLEVFYIAKMLVMCAQYM